MQKYKKVLKEQYFFYKKFESDKKESSFCYAGIVSPPIYKNNTRLRKLISKPRTLY